MTTLPPVLRLLAVVLASLLSASLPKIACASDTGEPSKPPPPPASLEEVVRAQQALLERMQEELRLQRSELERVKTELEAARRDMTSSRDAIARPAATEIAAAAEIERTPAAPADKPDPGDRLGQLAEHWGRLRLSGDIRFRYEGFYNQGYDAPQIVDARNRFRLRVRALLQGTINEHFDWGLGLASGSFDSPNSSNQTLGEYYNRKPFALDLAYLHFDTKTTPVGFEVYAGKVPITWKHTSLTFDENLRPDGLVESVRFEPKEAPLRRVTVSAWQLPFKEVVVGPDGVLYGGQVHTEWVPAAGWALSLAGAFHAFEEVDLIAPAIGVSPSLVNAGIEYGTTNALYVDPVTGERRYRSDFQVFNGLAEITYTGLHARWPVMVTADWLHNVSAYNNQRDGGTLTARVGRTQERGDVYGEYTFWKTERETFPSVFMESNVSLQTNSLAHIMEGGYMFNSRVLLKSRLSLTRRLETLAPVNRWQNRLQVDLTYRF